MTYYQPHLILQQLLCRLVGPLPPRREDLCTHHRGKTRVSQASLCNGTLPASPPTTPPSLTSRSSASPSAPIRTSSSCLCPPTHPIFTRCDIRRKCVKHILKNFGISGGQQGSHNDYYVDYYSIDFLFIVVFGRGMNGNSSKSHNGRINSKVLIFWNPNKGCNP